MPEVRLIDAIALMKRVCEKECGPHFDINLCDLDDDSTDTRCVFRDYVRAAPTIEAEPVRHGRWIEVTKHRDENGTILTDYECSECCAMVKDSDAEEIESERFCYNCGAKMCVTDTNVGGKGGADNDSE